MKPIIYYRASQLEEGELEAMGEYFPVTSSRMNIPKDSLVIFRYSALPFYKEQVEDLTYIPATPINSLYEHSYVADLGSYYCDLQQHTFPTWGSLYETPKDAGPFVLKGATNSKKHLFKTHMFSATWEDAVQVFSRLQSDTLIGSQHIYIRKYVPLKKLGETITGLPITKEFRIFTYKGKILAHNFYWDAFKEDIETIPEMDVPEAWLNQVLEIIKDKCPFAVVDIAQAENGSWWVVELNDGCQAGLSGIDPKELYKNLRKAIDEEYSI